MSVWSDYDTRMESKGGSRLRTSLLREERFIDRKLPNSLSYFPVEVYPPEYTYNVTGDEAQENKVRQSVAIISTTTTDTRTIITMPHDDIQLGALVYWMDNYWLVSDRDANTAVYTKATLTQCNHLLKWITAEHEIIEQWCMVSDGTKYLIGTYEDKDFFTTRADARMGMTIGKNAQTVLFDRTYRFLIDDSDAPVKMAYSLTKPLKIGDVYNGCGVYGFTLHEVSATDDDNHELGIADYYRHFPKDDLSNSDLIDEDSTAEDVPPPGKKVWL
ncbi:MAG: hypothetical protein LUD69_07915 [Oscillospiraceae bacterium]|nr:hypothetical protein [Oscillospiraceae bacterium]